MNKDLKLIIKKDCYRYFGDIKPKLWFLYCQNLRCQIIYRKANFYLNRNKLLYLFYNFKLKRISSKYAFNVLAKTTIGEGLFLNHNGPVTINPYAIIGKNCSIGICVTIGIEHRGKREGAPIIGNRVWIGANAVIVGKINIGDNVLIAPNAYINFDVPNNSIVIGNPGKIISDRPNATDRYIKNIIEDLE